MKAYLAVSAMSFRNTLAFRSNILFYAVGTILQLLLMLAVWGALDSQGALGGDLSFSKMATYSSLAFALNMGFSVFYIYGYLTELIRKGDLAMELVRPLHFMGNLLFRYFGFSVFRIGLLALPFGLLCWVILGIQLPADLPTALAFLLSAVLAYLVNYFVFFLFALLTFISLDNSGILMTFMSISSLFTGLYLPFWIFPDWLRPWAEALPFKAIYFAPISLWMGTEAPAGILGFQALWLGILVVASWGFWRLMVKRIVVQGG